MKSELLAQSPALTLPLVALFLFMAIFLGAVVLTMRKRAPALESLARMPLDDEGRGETSDATKGHGR